MDASIWMQANILKGVNLSFPPQVGERPASPILELRYYTFAELSNRTDDENLQLNIVFSRESIQWTLYFCVAKSGDVSIIISKIERKN